MKVFETKKILPLGLGGSHPWHQHYGYSWPGSERRRLTKNAANPKT